MSNLEPLAFCGIEEYRRFEDGRVGFSSIERGQLYTYMAKLDSEHREAARMTLRVVGAAALQKTVAVVFHDENLEELFELDMEFSEHEYSLPVNQVNMRDKRHDTTATIVEGYFKDYYEDMYDHMLLASAHRPVHASAVT